jgi:hypothetical protein
MVYEFEGASATFSPSLGNPFSATIGITGTFEIDPIAQTVVGIDANLSGLPAQLSSWSTFNNIQASFWDSMQFLATDVPHDDGFQPHFSDAFGGNIPNPLYQVTLWTQQWGPVDTLSVAGTVDPVPNPEPNELPAMALLTAFWVTRKLRSSARSGQR